MGENSRKDIIKNITWTVITILIAVLTITAIIGHTKGFSFEDAKELVRNGNKIFILLAVFAMFLYIYLEGAALRHILIHIGYRVSRRQGFLYSAADIYFSAITPSATGGQPASFYFMNKDGIPFSINTIVLILNLLMYGFALDFVAIVCFIVRPDIFMSYNTVGRWFIVIGFIIMSTLTFVFFMLLKEAKWMEKLGEWTITVLARLKIIKKPEKRREKLKETIEKYGSASDIALGKGRMLFEVFLINLAQRVTQISITVLVYLGLGGSVHKIADVWFTQGFAAVGSNSAPVPGAQGVADYLMLQGFSKIMSRDMAVHTELFSRGISFYMCITISLAAVALGYFKRRKRTAPKMDYCKACSKETIKTAG